MLALGILLFSLAALPHLAICGRNTDYIFSPMKKGIEWQDCGPPGFSCGAFEVPLNWHNPAAGHGRLSVVKVNATKERKGVLFTHPGPLAGAGVDWLESRSEAINNHLTHGSYDIVSWDMRGSSGHVMSFNISTFPPSPRCFVNQTEESELWWKYQPIDETDLPPRNMSTYKYRSTYRDVSEYYQKTKKHHEKCLSTQLEHYTNVPYFEYLGTAATVRDLIALADEIQGPGLPINLWAVSYGSLIGSYLINMFPERVGRVLMDGPVDPEQYVSTPSHLTWKEDINNANSTFSTFIENCSTSPALCKSVNRGSLYDGEFVRTFAADLLAIARSTLLGFQSVFGLDVMRNPTLQNWASTLHNATGGPPQNNFDWNWTTTFHNRVRDFSTVLPIGALGTICGDHVDQAVEDVDDKKLIRDIVDMAGQYPLLAQNMIYPAMRYQCHLWPVRAVERYFGPWDRKPANPVLLVGNTLNPLNGIGHARRVAEQMGDNAVLIEQEGLAGSFFPHHPRATAMMGKFLREGVLPSDAERIITAQEDLPIVYRIKGELQRLLSLRISRSSSTLLSIVSALLFLVFIAALRYVRAQRKISAAVLPIQREKADLK